METKRGVQRRENIGLTFSRLPETWLQLNGNVAVYLLDVQMGSLPTSFSISTLKGITLLLRGQKNQFKLGKAVYFGVIGQKSH